MSEERHDPPGDDPDARSRLPAEDSAERRRVAKNLRKRQRYAEDEDYRRKTLAATKAWRNAHRKQVNCYVRQRRANNPEVREKDNARCRGEAGRNRHLKRNYGISLADYNAMWTKQQGVCAICETNPDGKLFVDHDHDRKQVRQLLCRCCNLALGLFKDRPSLVERGAAYLRKHGRKD